MTRVMKSLASATRCMMKTGIQVPFTKEDLKLMGIRVPKDKLHLIKQLQVVAEKKEDEMVLIEVPKRFISTIKKQAKIASVPWTVYEPSLRATYH